MGCLVGWLVGLLEGWALGNAEGWLEGNAVATATANKLTNQRAARIGPYFPAEAVAKAAKEPSKRGIGLPLLKL